MNINEVMDKVFGELRAAGIRIVANVEAQVRRNVAGKEYGVQQQPAYLQPEPDRPKVPDLVEPNNIPKAPIPQSETPPPGSYPNYGGKLPSEQSKNKNNKSPFGPSGY